MTFLGSISGRATKQRRGRVHFFGGGEKVVTRAVGLEIAWQKRKERWKEVVKSKRVEREKGGEQSCQES